MDEYRMARRVLIAEVSGGRVRRRQRFGWMDQHLGMDCVKVALGNRGMMMEVPRRCTKESTGTNVTERVLPTNSYV